MAMRGSMGGGMGGLGMGGLGTLNQALTNLGYTEDTRGNVFYPDGTIMTGPDVLTIQRPRTMDSPISIYATPGASNLPNANTVTLPSGQAVTQEQLQQLLAAQKQQEDLLSAGATGTGIRIGNTTISWPMIMIAALAFVLLQSKGYQKRS
jgi:hypothetical protein